MVVLPSLSCVCIFHLCRMVSFLCVMCLYFFKRLIFSNIFGFTKKFKNILPRSFCDRRLVLQLRLPFGISVSSGSVCLFTKSKYN